MNSLINFITKGFITICVSDSGQCKCRCSVCECSLDAHEVGGDDDVAPVDGDDHSSASTEAILVPKPMAPKG